MVWCGSRPPTSATPRPAPATRGSPTPTPRDGAWCWRPAIQGRPWSPTIEISLPDESRFNHYDDWPGWPAHMRRRDWDRNPQTGYREFWKILPSHSSLTHFMWDDYAQDLEGPVKWKRKIMLHGLTAETDVEAVIPLARSWESPPALRLRGSGYTGGGYDKAQRAYRVEKISRDARPLEAILEGSPESPLVNLALVIGGWPEGVEARLVLDGRAVPGGPGFRQGLERTPGGGTALVVWLEVESSSPVTLAIAPRGGGRRSVGASEGRVDTFAVVEDIRLGQRSVSHQSRRIMR